MTAEQFKHLIEQDLERRLERSQLRRRTPVRPVGATHVEIDGRRYVNFASNNYLGLSHHPRLIEAACRATTERGVGSGSAALVTGYTDEHRRAEQEVARWKGTEASVLLPSGYQANLAAVETVASVAGTRGARFLIDKLAHASLIDAVRASGMPFRVFPHNGLAKLERLLAQAEPDELQVVVTESIFSMDGDAADLRGIAALKRKYGFLLLLDEAHGSGVYGPGGSGLAAETRLQPEVDLSVVTLSKAFGLVGGAVCGSKVFCDAVINHARAYLFSTSLPPAVAAAAVAAIAVMREEPQRQQRVRALARGVRDRLAGRGLRIPAGDSPIVPIIVGAEADALAASRRLREKGLWVPAIRPPTVPRGSSRLRVTLCGEHADDEVDQLCAAIEELTG